MSWIVLQNTSDEVPPADDAVVEWDDLGMAGGGLATNVVRTVDGRELWAGSDVGGVASLSTLAPIAAWQARSGDPVLGALTSHPDLGVWDVLPTSWGDVFMLTGRYYDTSLMGGFWRSEDGGDSWEELIDSVPTTSDAMEVTIAGFGLVEEPDTEGVYIANEDAEDLGLHFYDGTNFCPIMVFSEMDVDATIGAMARVVSADNDLPGLLVGYRGDDDGFGVDGVWYWDGSDPTPDGCDGYEYDLAISTTFHLWSVGGMDAGCDGSAWDPEADTEWEFWPEPTTVIGHIWQTTAAHDAAFDAAGNAWVPVGDLGLFQRPVGVDEAEVDCLWDHLNAGGKDVAVGWADDAVWVTFYQQSLATGAHPHSMGVFRTRDEGVTWEYEGAAVANANNYRVDLGGNEDHLYCGEDWAYHRAEPFSDTTTGDEGNAFIDATGTIDELDDTNPSWGNPAALDAYSAYLAVVGFGTYDNGTTTHVGRIGYTLDGGDEWHTLPFDDRSGTCDEEQFYTGINEISLLRQPDRTYDVVDNFGDPISWRVEFFVSSNDRNGTTTHQQKCALARVVIEPDAFGDPDATWTWYDLDRNAATPACEIDGKNISGVVTAAWGENAFIWGQYRTAGGRIGGVCSVDIDDPTTRGMVIDPDDWQLTIGGVSTHPWVSGLLVVAPQMDAVTWSACNTVADGNCPDVPRTLFAEEVSGTWTIHQADTMPPHLVSNGTAWAPEDLLTFIYATAGGGAFQGDLSWP